MLAGFICRGCRRRTIFDLALLRHTLLARFSTLLHTLFIQLGHHFLNMPRVMRIFRSRAISQRTEFCKFSHDLCTSEFLGMNRINDPIV
ncbi:hypothetical protein WT01_36355 [Burkholderia cepacia]|nr:hypothetical protein WT01_36355 [Burkholderia cepacia]